MRAYILAIAMIAVMATTVMAQNYCVGVGTANPTFKLDVNGNFRVQGEALFQDGATITGGLVTDNILIAGTKVCREDGTNCPAAQGSQFTLTQASATEWTNTNINDPDTCDGNKNQEYLCVGGETRSCVDIKPSTQPGVFNLKRTVACRPETLATDKYLKPAGLCVGDTSCSPNLHVPGGLYGSCAQTGTQAACSSALAPATCEQQSQPWQPKECRCPQGYQKVGTGQYTFSCGDGDTCTNAWFSCYKSP